jgi:non-specific serine/threonine protein kinase
LRRQAAFCSIRALVLGNIIGGRYVLVGLLGQGGMGSVYDARDKGTGHRVAVKLISTQPLGSPLLAERLEREARAAGSISSRHVTRLLDTGTDTNTGLPYIVMEYLAGENLQRWFKRLGPLSPELALRIVAQACMGLESAHAAGLVHRDIKPANLVLAEVGDNERVVKLLDFGLAKLQPGLEDRTGWDHLTHSGGLLGSPFYMSPEQARGRREVDHRSDLWSLGVVLYHALTGQKPHEDIQGLGELIIAICQRPAPLVTRFAPWVSPEVARLVGKALELEPDRRFQSAREMREALCALLPGGTELDASLLVPLNLSLVMAGTHRSAGLVSVEPREQVSSLEHTVTLATTGTRPPETPLRLGQLPSSVTRLIGRERESAELAQRVSDSRLVTLLGPGGTGKTRLSIHVATELAHRFEHGAGFVDLSPLTDPEALPRAVAVALGIREEPEQPLRATLLRQLRNKEVLVVLDNCEHLVADCAELAEQLLAACPRLRMIATSREALAISGETTYLLAPLPIPLQTLGGAHEEIAKNDAVRLFVERAQAVNPAFTLSSTNANSVAHICRQLDGIPLAIELAAARSRAMTVEQLAAQVDDRFRLLAGVRRGTSRRQQTLRALIDWSHELLSEAERAVLRRLSVFQGGFSLAAAEAVCTWEGDALWIDRAEVFELLYLLVSKSLVVAEEHTGTARYRMLETIRHYARDKLQATDEEARARARHVDYFLQLAEEAEPALRGEEQLSWLGRLELEHDNLRAALDACDTTPERTELALRLAGALGRFWWLRGHHSEGCARLKRLLERSAGISLPVRAKAVCQLALLLPGILRAHPAWQEGLAAWRAVGDARGIAFALIGTIEWEVQRGHREAALLLIREGLAHAREVGDSWLLAWYHEELGRYHRLRLELVEATRTLEEGLELARSTGDRWLVGVLLRSLALTSSFRSEYVRAKVLLQECLELQQLLGFKRGTAETLVSLGGALQCLGEYDESDTCFEKTLALAREIGCDELTAKAYLNLGENAQMRGERARACSSLRALFELASSISNKDMLAWGLFMTGLLARDDGLPEQAMRFFAAKQLLEERFSITLHPHWRRNYDDALAALRSSLGETGENAWAEGRKMSPAQAIQAALTYLATGKEVGLC